MKSNIKHLKSLLLFIILSILVLQCTDDNDRDNYGVNSSLDDIDFDFQWLSTSGNMIVDEDGNQVILHGVNRSGFEYNYTGNGQSSLEYSIIIEDWHAKIVRLPFNQQWIMQGGSYLDYIDQSIYWIKSYGAYVLLDLQWESGDVGIPPMPNEQAITMWTILADRYKDDPAILYDIFNEVHSPATFADWRVRAMEIIDGIKSVHPQALCLVSGTTWSSYIGDWALNPLSNDGYDNIVYSVHRYPGWDGQAATLEQWRNVWDAHFGGYAGMLPIFAGEIGTAEGTYNEVTHLYWLSELINYLDEKEIGWCAWSWVNVPLLTIEDRETPTLFGTVVKAALERYADVVPQELQLDITEIHSITDTRATIRWETNFSSDSKILYGTQPGVYTDSVYAPIPLFAHSIKLENLQPETEYFFKAKSVGLWGQTAVSDGHSLTTLIAPPATPGNFALNIFSDAQVDLSWSDVQNEDGYMIYFATAQAGIYEVLGQVGADENTYSHLLDIPGTVYYYKVSAFNATGSSGLTAPLNPLPLTPTGFTAVAVAGGIINLNWNAVGSAEGYRIYRQIQGQPSFVELTTTAADVTTYQDTGLAGFVLHYYKIASYNAFGESPLSSLVYALALP